MIYARFLDFPFEHPAKEEPSWKGIVERWYQLDPFAYGLAEAYTKWKPLPAPAMILLASPQASNETDFQFATTGATSPAKFVHTLPNIRCSSLCQVMDWTGPVLCVQKDPSTLAHALREALAFLEYGAGAPIWVVSAFRDETGYRAQAFVLSRNASSESFAIRRNPQRPSFNSDRELQKCLDSNPEELIL